MVRRGMPRPCPRIAVAIAWAVGGSLVGGWLIGGSIEDHRVGRRGVRRSDGSHDWSDEIGLFGAPLLHRADTGGDAAELDLDAPAIDLDRDLFLGACDAEPGSDHPDDGIAGADDERRAGAPRRNGEPGGATLEQGRRGARLAAGDQRGLGIEHDVHVAERDRRPSGTAARRASPCAGGKTGSNEPCTTSTGIDRSPKPPFTGPSNAIA